jgi:hypothetical protein
LGLKLAKVPIGVLVRAFVPSVEPNKESLTNGDGRFKRFDILFLAIPQRKAL